MKRTALYIPLIVSMLSLSCGDEDPVPEIAYELPSTHQPTSTVLYEVEGGGQISFTVEDVSDSLMFNITSYHFDSTDCAFTTDKNDVDAEDVAMLEALFQGTVNIGGVIYRNELPTGTWTYVYIEYDHDWLRIANGDVISELGSLRRHVTANLDSL